MTGSRFGRLVVLSLDDTRHGHGAFWECLCECGKTKSVRGDNLRRGVTISCGCRGQETLVQGRESHGWSRTKLYKTWASMKDRCGNPRAKAWKDYGGRGITVCPEWLEFDAFLRDMLPTWAPGLTLERTDNDLGYGPSNVVWATRADQMKNTRRSVFVDTPLGPMALWRAKELWSRPQAEKFTRVSSGG